MAPLKPVPNVLRIQYQHNYSVSPAWVHAFYRYTGGAPTVTDAAAIANSMKSAWVTNCAPLAVTSLTLVTVRVTDLTSDSAAQNQSTGTAPGTRPGVVLTAGDSVLVNQHVQRRWRGGHPRQYWPFGVAADLAGPLTWTTALQTAVNSAMTAMNAAAAAITWTGGGTLTPVAISYFSGSSATVNEAGTRATTMSTPRPTPIVDPILTHSVNLNVATQRRRLAF